jgi:endo-alpha-1,4-polygalactosaminidase (GH114 family)
LTDEAADMLEAANARIAQFERILDGLPQDAIDGGWTARGASAYAKQLESRVADLEADVAFQKSVTDAARQQQSELLARAENAEARVADGRADDAAQAGFSIAARDVLAERERQMAVENWTPDHDDGHNPGVLAVSAACYALQVAADLSSTDSTYC